MIKKKKRFGARGMTQLLKHLPFNHGDRSLDSKNPYISGRQGDLTVITASETRREGISTASWLVKLAI